MDRFRGRTVLVTGAAAGLGRSIALRLAAEGCAIAGVDVQADELKRTLEEVGAFRSAGIGNRGGRDRR